MIRVGLIYPERSVIKDVNWVWVPCVPRIGDEINDQYGRLTVEKVLLVSVKDEDDGTPPDPDVTPEIYCYMKFDNDSIWNQH